MPSPSPMTGTLPAYIVHLPAQTERFAHIRDMLARFPLFDLRVVEAIDGRKVLEEERNKSISPHYVRYAGVRGMTAGEWGCAMSHRKVCEQFLQDGGNVCAVFEDDVLLSANAQQAVEAALPWLDSPRPRMVLLMPNLFVSTRGESLDNGFRLHRVQYGAGAYAFLMNRTAADIRLRRMLPFRTPCDWWMPVRRWGVDVRAVTPHVASFAEDRSDSTIEQARQKNWKREDGVPLNLFNRLGLLIHKRFPDILLHFRRKLGFVVFFPKLWE